MTSRATSAPPSTVLPRRAVLGGLAAAAVASAAARHDAAAAPAGPTPSAPASRRTNFLLVVVDDLGWGEVGANGQELIATPVLDRLARDGVNFTDAYATPTCAPTRCSLYTGFHTGHARVKNNGGSRTGLLAEDLTLAEILRDAGYRTGHVGKWALGLDNGDNPSHPNRQGVDHFFGYINQTHAHDYWPTYLWRNGERLSYPENEGADVTFAGDLITEEALGFLDGVGEDPFFLTVAYNTPHAPNEMPTDAPYSARPWPQGERNHAAQVTWTDAQVGLLLDRLRRRGLADDTVVLFVSDNGPHREGAGYDHVGSALPHDPEFFDSNGPLRGIKRDVYEGGVRVPMIGFVPGAPRGRTVADPVAVWDVLPTFTQLAGAPTPSGIDGVSFAGVLRGRHRRRKESRLYWQFTEDKQRDEAVRFGKWKAVRQTGGPVELYHLGRDVGETTDVAGRHPALVARAERLMAEAVA